jgi:hypothetical protein
MVALEKAMRDPGARARQSLRAPWFTIEARWQLFDRRGYGFTSEVFGGIGLFV